MTTAPTQAVDVNVPRFNQAIVAVLTGTAFVLDIQWLVAVVAAILLVSRIGGPRLAPLTQLYIRVIRSRLPSDRPREFEAAEPPRFAQMLGAMILTAATALFFVGLTTLGWSLALAVTALAALAASTRICIGCIIYQRIVE
jgi:hypothetical protein